MKSHLAYYFLLDQARATGEDRKNCLLVTLRDDLASARDTLGTIAEHHFGVSKDEAPMEIDRLLQEDCLEILENESGRISPEEFFNKLYVAVHRPRKHSSRGADVVVLNGLDQLEARFPLIAAEQMFVPALIRLLKANNVCSLIISAVGESTTEMGRSIYGLPPMADLILKFDQISPDETFQETIPPIQDALHVVMVEAQRLPGGQIGGKKGFLYRRLDKKLAYSIKKTQFNSTLEAALMENEEVDGTIEPLLKP